MGILSALCSTRLAFTLAALFFCTLAEVEAIPIRWTLSNVNFSDGSSVTGDFVFDADAGSPSTGLTDFRVSVLGGNLMPDFVYEHVNPLSQLLIYSFQSTDGPQEVINAFRGRNPSDTAFELLYLDPVSFLSNAGGTIRLDLVKSSAQLSDGESTYARSVLTSGSLIGVLEATVPEPSNFPIFLIGGSLLAVCKIRRNLSSTQLAKSPVAAHYLSSKTLARRLFKVPQ